MLRDPNLIPLSHQHQHALALCVQLERGLRAASPDVAPFRSQVARLFEAEIRFHFDAEEKVLFPAAERLHELRDLVRELLGEHGVLRGYAARAESLTAAELLEFASVLSGHVRKEERRLFEDLQRLLPHEELVRLGAALNEYFRTSGMPGASCEIPEA